MKRIGWVTVGAFSGLLLLANAARAAGEPTLIGQKKFGLGLESELVSRDVKIDGVDDRLRVARQSVVLTYGVLKHLDLFIKGGLGQVVFEEIDLDSETRPLAGVGLRASRSFLGGYFAGASFQHQMGKVSKFEQGAATLTIKDKWTEQDATLFIGSKDLIRPPEPDFRIYLGGRFSTRTDKRSPEGGVSSTSKEDSSIGALIGFDYSDRNIFRFNAEFGTLDRNNIRIIFGLIF